MSKPRAYFLGASGVGKTTLARYVSERYDVPMLSGATKLALEKVGCTFDDLLVDAKVADDFQRCVWEMQQAIERPHWEDGCGFVSDRSIDLLAYTAKQSRVVRELMHGVTFGCYVERMKRAHVFFVRPCEAVKAKLDGRRDRFLSPEWVWGVDAVIEFVLECEKIPYVTLGSPSLKDRVATVDAVLAGSVTPGGK